MKYLKTYNEIIESFEHLGSSGFHEDWKDRELTEKIYSLKKYTEHYDKDGDFYIEKPIRLDDVTIYFTEQGHLQSGADEVTETDGELIYIPCEYDINTIEKYKKFRNYFLEIDEFWFDAYKMGLI